MAYREDLAFEAENGVQVTENNSSVLGPFYTGGPNSPVGLDLSVNTFYVQNTGDRVVLWQKFGPLVSNWRVYPASDIGFNNTGTDFSSDNVQDALEEVGNSASPGFSYGRSGLIGVNTWLLNETVPSNRTGRTVSISSPVVKKVAIANRNISSFEVTFYEHEGNSVNLNTLGSVNVVNSRSAEFTVSVPVTQNKQIAVRLTDISSGTVRDLVVGLIITGGTV